MKVLVTGGCGYIGSHQVVSLLRSGHEVVVIDDLSNSSPVVVERIENLVKQPLRHYVVDISSTSRVEQILRDHQVEAIIHFAGYKHVRESVSKPTKYYRNNVGGLLSLVDAARVADVRKIVFSSSGSVYGETTQVPIVETHPLQPTNPYSTSKTTCERILSDLCAADCSWSVVSLRYFNPAGADESGHLGDASPLGASNLLPVLMEVANGQRSHIDIYGMSFATPDGSGVRDYVHVGDVAETHLRALDYLQENTGHVAINIGRGEGVSVVEMIDVVEEVTGSKLNRVVHPAKSGDVGALFGDTTRSQKFLGDMSYRSLLDIVDSAWKFQKMNPKGYVS